MHLVVMAVVAAAGGGGGMNAVATTTAMVAVASDVTAVHQPLRTKACRCRRRRQN